MSEELAFRGVLFTFVENFFGTAAAYLVSSLLFAMAHSPIFGANTVVEIVFGSYFAYTFVASGYNIAVPIAVHVLYDFVTMLSTWMSATQELRKKINDMKTGALASLKSDNEIVLARAVS